MADTDFENGLKLFVGFFDNENGRSSDEIVVGLKNEVWSSDVFVNGFEVGFSEFFEVVGEGVG